MSKELVISSNLHETKVGIVEDDQLVEIYFQRANEYSLAGSIHKGRVTRVLPGMQSAFVDLGLERDTFLYVSDFFEENGEEFDAAPAPEPRPSRAQRQALPPPVHVVEPPPAQPDREEPAVASEPTPPAAAAGPTPERGAEDRNDRRGRRSRRRRGRGRGFPD